MTANDSVGSVQAIATEIRAALEGRDLTRMGRLLADDARWGDDDGPRTCRSRDDVLATFRSRMTEGVEADITDVIPGEAGVACHLMVRWPDPEDRARGTDFYHVYLVNEGLITEIRRYDDRDSALEAVGASQP